MDHTPSVALQLTRFYVQKIFVPIVVTVGILGNICNIVVLSHPRMTSSTNVYLTILAACDMLYLVFSLTLGFVFCSYRDMPESSFQYIPYGRVLSDIFGNTAVWLTVAFTIERYIGVCHPMKGKIWCTVTRARWIVLHTFLICLTITFPEFFEMEIAEVRDVSANTTYYICRGTELSESHSYQIGYYWFYVTFFTLLPLLLLAIFNSFLIKSVWEAIRIRRELQNSSSRRDNRTHQEQHRITIMLITVVIMFMLSQLPWTILLLYKAFLSANDIPANSDGLRIAGNITNLLGQVNASCNFLLYSYFSTRFRKTFQKLVCSWNENFIKSPRLGTRNPSHVLTSTVRGNREDTACDETLIPLKSCSWQNGYHGNGVKSAPKG
ncbi:FMRFamide receptor-like [Liolophura sinensis]|uniref:FMRFamide receptor-like n=1 Tax=Liolophura sinensis TaxID=3198878 RepID=UPI0031593F17